eukprot:m.189865 g.189865  ORF g.189865 m.189865 type:complete len:81 (-) comp32388_c2_seq6:815-1057(-)
MREIDCTNTIQVALVNRFYFTISLVCVVGCGCGRHIQSIATTMTASASAEVVMGFGRCGLVLLYVRVMVLRIDETSRYVF